MTNSEIRKIVETKIYPKYIQINKDQKDIPIWLKHCDKETAEQLKPLCEPYRNNPQDFFYLFWLPRSYENYDKNTTKFQELKHFEKAFPEFLQELEGIISGKEHSPPHPPQKKRKRIFNIEKGDWTLFTSSLSR